MSTLVDIGRAMRGFAAILSLTLGLALSAPAMAGQPCTERRLSAAELAQSLELAAKTTAALDRSGAEAAVLARAGQNLSEWGLRYSHLAIA
jgi:hypothetical protein